MNVKVEDSRENEIYPIKFEAKFTKDEEFNIYKLKNLLKENKVNYDEVLFTDSFFVRTLRGRDNNLNEAYKMFTDYLKYREDNNLENINKFQISNLNEIKKYYPHCYHNIDKFGRPIYIEKVGDLNVDNLFKITNAEDMIKYYVQDYEVLFRKTFPICSEVKGDYIGQILMIADLNGVGLSMLSSKVRDFISLKSKVDQTYYPEKIGKIFLINTNFMFRALWAIVKIFIAERTKKKITTLGSSYLNELLEVVDKNNLPKFLGGNCECKEGCINSNIGPWNDDIHKNRNYKKYT